jgi:hypothetical protein
MLAAPDLANLLLHKLARLGGRRFARALILSGLPDCSSFRHGRSPVRGIPPREMASPVAVLKNTNVLQQEMVPNTSGRGWAAGQHSRSSKQAVCQDLG